MNDAPLHRDTVALAGVLIDELGEGDALLERLVATALDLVETVTLAVARRDQDRLDRIDDADAALRVFRVHLQLAHDLSLLPEETYLDLVEQADLVGRQLGGWLKTLRQA